MDIENFANEHSVVNPINYVKVSSNTQKIQALAKHLYELLPVIKEEFEDLEKRSKYSNNDIFPIKMAALSDLYKATKPLYTWYIEKAKK